MKYKDNIVIQVYVPNTVYDTLKKMSAEQGLSLSSYLRTLLISEVRKLDEHQKDK